MSYCRFENTSRDLSDCFENIESTELSRDEKQARLNLVLTAADMLQQLADGMPLAEMLDLAEFKNKVGDYFEYLEERASEQDGQ